MDGGRHNAGSHLVDILPQGAWDERRQMIKYYWLDITIDGTPSTFKVAAISGAEATKICQEYFPGKTVKVLEYNEGPWDMGAAA